MMDRQSPNSDERVPSALTSTQSGEKAGPALSQAVAVAAQALRRSDKPVLNAKSVLAMQSVLGNRAMLRIIGRAQQESKAEETGQANGPTPDAAVSKALESHGQAFPAALGERFSNVLGTDSRDVRIHTGNDSAVAAKAISARAFTVGKDIHFGAGEYAPETAQGQQLIAHEAVHTVQQAGAVQTSSELEISNPGDPAELEAESLASTMVGGSADRASNNRVAAETGGVVSRQPAPAAAPAAGPGMVLVNAGPQQATPVASSGPIFGPFQSTPAQKDQFLHLCSQVNTKIDLAGRKAAQWLASVSLAYRDAWKNHTDALSSQAEFERLMGDLIFGAALAFLPGGLGGLLGNAVKNTAKDNFFIMDGVKDLAKWSMRTGGQMGARAIEGEKADSEGLSAFPTDPSKWRDTYDLQIQGDLVKFTEVLDSWQTRANADDSSFDMSFNPVAVMEKALSIAGTPAASLAPVDVASTSLLMEKGMWAKWLQTYGFKLVGQASRVGVFYGAEANVGKKVRHRCEAIGLPIDQYVAVSQKQIDDEARKRNANAIHGI